VCEPMSLGRVEGWKVESFSRLSHMRTLISIVAQAADLKNLQGQGGWMWLSTISLGIPDHCRLVLTVAKVNWI